MTHIPVENQQQIEMRKALSPGETAAGFPSLKIDFPKEANAKIVYWTGRRPLNP